jgi:hypothetical protein
MLTLNNKFINIELKKRENNNYQINIISTKLPYFEEEKIMKLYNEIISKINEDIEIIRDIDNSKYIMKNITSFSLIPLLKKIKATNILKNNPEEVLTSEILKDLKDPNIEYQDIKSLENIKEKDFNKFMKWLLNTQHSNKTIEERKEFINKEKDLIKNGVSTYKESLIKLIRFKHLYNLDNKLVIEETKEIQTISPLAKIKNKNI